MTDQKQEQKNEKPGKRGYKSPELIALEAIRDIDDPEKIRSNTELSDEEIMGFSVIRATSDWFKHLDEIEKLEDARFTIDQVKALIRESKTPHSIMDLANINMTERQACEKLSIAYEEYVEALKYVEEHPHVAKLFFHEKLVDYVEQYRPSLDRQGRREKYGALTAYSKMGMNIRLGQFGSLAANDDALPEKPRKKILGIF